MKRQTVFQVSDKAVLMRPIKAVECFRPVPEVGKVYVIRDVDGGDKNGSLRLVGIQGTHEGGQEVWLVAGLFRPLSEVQESPTPAPCVPEPETRMVPVVKVKWMSDEDWNRHAEGQAKALDIIRSALTSAHDCLKEGGWKDVEGSLLTCLDLVRGERQRAMENDDKTKAAKRTFFDKRPKPGDTLTLTYQGQPLRVQSVWKYRHGWHGSVYRTETVVRAFDGRYFLVRETEPHRFCPPSHGKWLDGLVRVKRLTLKGALQFSLRSGLFSFGRDVQA